MQKIFKRSRTPTGAEMKTQSSLEVPKQVRSASFDEIQLEAKRQQNLDPTGFLKVPPHTGQRSKSFDSSQNQSDADPGTFLEVPTRTLFQRRRSSGDKMATLCVHCACVEEYNRIQSRQSSGEEVLSLRSFSYSDSSATSEDFDSFDYEQTEDTEPPDIDVDIPSPCITVTLSPVPPCTPTFDIITCDDEIMATTTSTRRRSVTSPKLERQQAFIFPESLETQNSSETTYTTSESDSTNQVFNLTADFNAFTISDKTAVMKSCSSSNEDNGNPVIVSEFFLTVPDLKRDRAASMDSCFINKQSPSGKPEEVVPIPSSQLLLEPPSASTLRSRSVDIVLPTDQQARYRALSCQHDAFMNQQQTQSVALARGYVTISQHESFSVFYYYYQLLSRMMCVYFIENDFVCFPSIVCCLCSNYFDVLAFVLNSHACFVYFTAFLYFFMPNFLSSLCMPMLFFLMKTRIYKNLHCFNFLTSLLYLCIKLVVIVGTRYHIKYVCRT